MKKKYQIFISSTYLDLIKERQRVLYSLLKTRCIPVGMELFPASNKDPMTYIKKVIDDCDYYLLIIGGRYGSLKTGTGTSFTELEYRYAIKKRKPVMAFVQNNPRQKKTLRPESKAKQGKLISFRNSLGDARLIKAWNSRANLAEEVSNTIDNFIEENPASGWIPGVLDSEHHFDQSFVESVVGRLRSLKSDVAKMLGKPAIVRTKYFVHYPGNNSLRLDFADSTRYFDHMHTIDLDDRSKGYLTCVKVWKTKRYQYPPRRSVSDRQQYSEREDIETEKIVGIAGEPVWHGKKMAGVLIVDSDASFAALLGNKHKARFVRLVKEGARDISRIPTWSAK